MAEKEKAIEGVIYLCKCAIVGQVPDKTIISNYNLEHLYKAASKHMLAAMVGLALQSAGLEDKNYKHAIYNCQRKTIILKRREKESLRKA